MNLVDVKYIAKNNSESISTILLLRVVNCSSDTNCVQISTLPNIFLECQIANKMIACVCNSTFDNARRWSSYTTRYYTHILLLPCTSAELKFILGTPRNLGEYLIFFLFTVSAVRLSLSQRHGASWRWGWRNGLQTWTVAANILNVQSRTEVKWWSSTFVFGRGVNRFSPQKYL